MSKKVCFTLETSAVNLMVELKLFAVSRNASRASLPCIHFMSIPSINLSHENGFKLTDCISCFPYISMNILAYDGAILYPWPSLEFLKNVYH